MTRSEPQRLAALDVLRGLAVAGMIVVTSPGDWNRAYWPLKHADWNGWTPTDIVFPMFLFGVGMAIGLSFPRQLADPAARSQYWIRVGRRVAALILLGLFLNWMYVVAVAASVPPAGPDDHPALRLPGVPQRIAFCYLLASGLILATARKDADGRTAIDARAVVVAIAAILLAYWALLSFVPVPGYGAGHLDPEGSLPAYFDRMIFTPRHMWPLGSATWRGPVTYDPEGLLSSLPATVNVLFGVLAGREWRRPGGPRVGPIAVASALLVLLGLLLDPLFPINKRLWTSSFALLSSGLSGLTLVAIVLAIGNRPASRLLTPLKILGGNAILAFTISILAGSFAGLPLNGASGPISPQGWGDAVALSVIPDEYLASLACAIAILALITLAVWPLHRRAIHFRL
jgi:predicted acyltransferase